MIVAPPVVEDAADKKVPRSKACICFRMDGGQGAWRRRNLDSGFVLSDHADWSGLLDVIKGTGAELVKLTHGDGDPLARYLQQQGINGSILGGANFRTEEE